MGRRKKPPPSLPDEDTSEKQSGVELDEEPKPKSQQTTTAKGKGKARARKAPPPIEPKNSDEAENDVVVEEDRQAGPSTRSGGKRRAALRDTNTDDGESQDDGGDSDNASVATGRNYVAPEESKLPPLSSLPSIFADIVARMEKLSDGRLQDVVKHLKGSKLRVATMCSGTESPLLALRMITRAMKEAWGLKLDIDHVFSCEIEPFKQAYIERNFHPRLLFRDVCELSETHAHTAYGSLVAVPGNVDMLVAGTSCVDFSPLNNKKKTIKDDGESGRTFRGMLEWARKHRPPIIILENVKGAPWSEIKRHMEDMGYSAEHRNLDTKQFYIPHTRQRGYLIAVDRVNSPIPQRWQELVGKMQRPASVVLDAFLLQSDDPRIHREREKLVQASYNTDTRRAGRTDWVRCETRHHRVRLEEELGSKRPFTNWGEGHATKLPDFAWTDWGKAQVERVWDLLDISLLRFAKEGVDPSYKSLVWNVSQNVDRMNRGSGSSLGITPCLTPSMIPYITNRGGPMVGLEALHFQGLPVDELLLTREAPDQQANLAGNAMSTTVVGTSMLVALVLSQDLLRAGGSQPSKTSDGLDDESESSGMGGEMRVAKERDVAEHLSGLEQLVEKDFDSANIADVPLSDLLVAAERSARLCACEGRKDISAVEVQRCTDCGATTCVACGGRPEHNYQPIDVQAHPRTPPSDFARILKSVLPMALTMTNLDVDMLEELRRSLDVTIPDERWEQWRESALAAASSELRFVELKRQAHWVARYESDFARLELTLHPTCPTWLLYAKPVSSLPANADIRKVLLLPIARFRCSVSMFGGRWEVALPAVHDLELEIEGFGERVPSWESRLGLQGEQFKDKKVWSQLKVSVRNPGVVRLDRSVAGVYTLLQRCGTANCALHVRGKQAGDGKHEEPLFFFLDPSRCGKPDEDAFVFAVSHRRYDYGEGRPIIAKLVPPWRQSDVEGAAAVVATIPQVYIAVPTMVLKPPVKAVTVASPASGLTFSADKDSCETARALLVVRVPIGENDAEWPRGVLHELTHTEERTTFRRVAWLIERVKVVHDGFGAWHHASYTHDPSACTRCAPRAPDIEWLEGDGKAQPIENTTQAGEYERRLKARPAPFVTQLMQDGTTGVLRLGVNFASLMHRAAARLPIRADATDLELSWRLHTDFVPLGKLAPYEFKLLSNQTDPEHAQPPNFGEFPLRKEQSRSLSWMLAQERYDAPHFLEEEISEAILEPLGWRAEGRARRPVRVLGGVLADEVGYGKTAISLGLIDCTREAIREEVQSAPERPGKITVHATLLVVPGHLTGQWESEIEKFLDGRANYNVVSIPTIGKLGKLSIEQIMQADIVIISRKVLQSKVYFENLEALSGGAVPLPSSDGRYFDAKLDAALEGLREQVDRLRTEGSVAVLRAIYAGRKVAAEAEERARRSASLRRARDDTGEMGDISTLDRRMDSTHASTSTTGTSIAGGKRNHDELSGDEEDIKSRSKAKKAKKTNANPPRESKDPWKLKGAAAKKDYKKMLAPSLEMFHWSRIVIDEYTYVDGKALSVISRWTAERIWALSGTSPVNSFHSLKTISRFLKLHLGVHDDGEFRSKNDQKRSAMQSSRAEQFHSFREVHSLDWHAHRDTVGQAFLDQFARQNIAEIGEIQWKEHYVKIQLPAAERAIYLELEHHLRAQDMTIKRVRKTESDREIRLALAMGESRTAEEALLKRCSHFELNEKENRGNAVDACDSIVRDRTKERDACRKDLLDLITEAFLIEAEIDDRDQESPFRELVRFYRGNGVGDAEAKVIIETLLDEVGVDGPAPQIEVSKVDEAQRLKRKWDLREQSHSIRRLVKELVGRVRSLRYFTVVRDLQRQKDKPVVVDCPWCERDQIPPSEIVVLSSCGHTGCISCVQERAALDECVYAGRGPLACQSQARSVNIVRGETLGIEEEGGVEGRRYGAKLEQVVELLRDTSRIREDDRVLVFVQFPDLMRKVAEMFKARDIRFLQIEDKVGDMSKNLQRFQNGSDERILLLHVTDETASGANLTVANHAIFLSPLLTESQEEYDAYETQAIGRLRRYGQRQTVHIWRFVSMDTMDVEQYEKRRGMTVDELIAAASAVSTSTETRVDDDDVVME
ncbi:unnamed protein product [Peniophora sp. CBMAI 1063]|nr:unnamed protein product [Peniophora sp. CBMAI 1063]